MPSGEMLGDRRPGTYLVDGIDEVNEHNNLEDKEECCCDTSELEEAQNRRTRHASSKASNS